MPTDAEYARAAETAAKKTTIKYADWKRNVDQGKYNDVTTTEWYKVFDALGHIPVPPVVPPVEPPPTGYPKSLQLDNPIVFTPVSGRENYFDAGGRHAIIKHVNFTVEQGAANSNASNQNAIVSLVNAPKFNIEPLHIYAANRQRSGMSNAYGYGLYLGNCGEGHIDSYVGDGPGLAQALVMAAPNLKLKAINSKFNPMHPVWHLNAGKPAEVHTDSIQSWAGPYELQLFGCELKTCGTAIQVQPYKYSNVKQIGLWKFIDVDVQQVNNSESDEMPYCLTKDISSGGGAKFPTEFMNSYVDSKGTRFAVSWVSDPAAWNPGSSWNNTGEPWKLGVRV